MTRSRKTLPPVALTPHRCLVFGIDPGSTSGWAMLWRDAEGRDHLRAGSCRLGDAGEVSREAVRLAAELGLPLVVVAERWTAGGWKATSTLLGLGAAWGVWKLALEQAGVPKRRVVRVYSQTWRAKVIGGPQRKTEEWKRDAQRVTFARFAQDLDPDAAEAACIATWGAMASEVGAVVPRTRRAA